MNTFSGKRAKKLFEQEFKVKYEDMTRTLKFVRPSNLAFVLVNALLEFIVCNLSFFCYLFMIISQIANAGLISIAFPFAVFGYALMEEARPGKAFWNAMLKYTLFILFMKFIV